MDYLQLRQQRRGIGVLVRFALAALLLAGGLGLPTARAATLPVTTCNAADLIAAIEAANKTFAEDTITLQAGCTYTLTAVYAVESRGPNGLPLIERDTIIQGNGATILRASNAPRFRILEVDADTALTLNNLTIAGGHGADGGSATSGVGGSGQQGGAIYNAGTLSLDTVTLRNNRAGNGGNGSPGGRGGDGGALFNREDLAISRSTLRDNSAGDGGDGSGTGNAGAGGNGGALVNTGTLTISDSTLNNNRAGAGGNAAGGGLGGGGGDGGAISGTGAYVITRSTLSGNAAGDGGAGEQGGSGGPGGRGGDGGAIYSPTGDGAIIAGTLTANRSGSAQPNRIGGSGGGILPGPQTRVRMSIIAGNSAGAGGSLPECGAAVVSQGYNLFGATLCHAGSTQPGDLTAAEPVLGPLSSNGGPTQTHLPQAGSPARDRIPAAAGCGTEPLERDQRGFTRPGDTNCDIGAAEAGVGPAPLAPLIYLPLFQR